MEARQAAAVRRVLWPAAVVGLLAVAPANAQTSPPTVLPQPGELPPLSDPFARQIPSIPPAIVTPQDPLQPRAADAPPEVARPQTWSYFMGLGFGWDENIDASLLSGPSSWGTFLTGSVSYLRYRTNNQIRLSASGSGTAYRDFNVYNRPDASASVDGHWRFSRSVDGSLSAGYRYGHTDNSEWLSRQGLLYGLSAMQTYDGSASLVWRLASRTSLRLDARGVRADFQSEGLSASDSARASMGLLREIGKRDSLGLDSAWERTMVPEKRDSLYLSLHWRHTLSPRTAMLLEGGTSRTTGAPPSELASDLNFFGGASLSRKIGGKSTIEAAYRREVEPAFGIGGVRLVDRWTLAWSATLGQSWFVGLGATYSNEPQPTSEGAFSSGDGRASLGRRLGRRFNLSAAGRYRRSENTGLALREAYRVGGYLSWEPAAR